MNRLSLIRLVAALAATLALTNAHSASKELEEAMSHDGLAKISVKGIDMAYALPGQSLASYTRVMIDQPVEVAFAKNWDPDKTGSRFKLSTEERDNIKKGVGQLVYDEFVKELQTKGTYPIVTEEAPDVLRLRITIINLYVNAPDTMEAGRSRTYTTSAGEMTLVLEMFDSESGAIMARVLDRRESRNTGRAMMSSSVTNSQEARLMASSWARILREALDRAHGVK
jgi:Protein of unknown function (DUF3313)